MQQEVVYSRNSDTKQAVEEVCQKLSNKRDVILVLFMASSLYDFTVLTKEFQEKFPNSEVIGTTTAGEIGPMGFVEHTLVVTTMVCNKTRVKAMLIKDIQRFPILEKKKMIETASACGIRVGDRNLHKNAFAITFVNGLINKEEVLLSLIHAVMKNDSFQVLGSSAGDDGKFQKTFISLNGQITDIGSIILFLNTSCKFDIRKENLYKPIGKSIVITDMDIQKRLIRKIDGENPLSVFAKKLNMPKEEVKKNILKYPMGRVIGNDVYMCSLIGFNEDGTANAYVNVLPNTRFEILKSDNVMATVEETCKSVLEKINRPQFIFMVNCLLRTQDLKGMQLCNPIIEMYRKYYKTFCGYSCYGEQLNRLALNQTLVMVTIGE